MVVTFIQVSSVSMWDQFRELTFIFCTHCPIAALWMSVFAWGINLNGFSKEYCGTTLMFCVARVFRYFYVLCRARRAKQIIQWFFLYFVILYIFSLPKFEGAMHTILYIKLNADLMRIYFDSANLQLLLFILFGMKILYWIYGLRFTVFYFFFLFSVLLCSRFGLVFVFFYLRLSE